MTVEEFKVQIALGIITEDRLKRIGFQSKYFTKKTMRVYKHSWMHQILVAFVKHNNTLTRTEATRNQEGAWIPLKKLEIFGWLQRDFPYTRFAGTGKPLTLTLLGQKVCEIISQSDKKSELVPIEINFEALQGHLFK